jgi:hypothetical protein
VTVLDVALWCVVALSAAASVASLRRSWQLRAADRRLNVLIARAEAMVARLDPEEQH